MLSHDEIEKIEKRNAAYHEAAHAVLVHILGEQLHRVRIFPVDNPTEDEKTWTGQASFRIFNQDNRVPIGLAGVVAETLARDNDDAPASAAEWLEWLEDEIIIPSETDMEGIGNLSEDDFEKTISLVRGNWEAIAAVAERLIHAESGEIDWSEVAELTERTNAEEN
ncbi:MAG: hypothetical protein ACI9R3_005987 [Verrucomicrobiales bacterium]|jgi:hypothetical protein